MTRSEALSSAAIFRSTRNAGRSICVHGKKRAPYKYHEQEIQIAIVKWLKLVNVDAIWYHVPNGCWRSRAEAGILKAMGVMPGVYDLVFNWRSDNGLMIGYVEVKRPGGRLSANEKLFAQLCDKYGISHEMVTDVSDMPRILDKWGIGYA